MREGVPHQNEKSPWRLRTFNEKFVEAYVSKVHVRGLEVLDKIPPEKKKVLVTTHISDFDMPIVLNELSSRLDILVGDMSPHHHLMQDPQGFASKMLVGSKNFGKIDFRADKSLGVFNPDNFAEIAKTVETTGKTVLIAAHSPAQGSELPKNGGYSAVYLANIMENTVLIPVSVSLRSDKAAGLSSDYAGMRKERPEADMVIGEPIELQKISDIGDLAEIMEKRKSGAKLSSGEREKFSGIAEGLRTESAQIMDSLAIMLPEEKRGSWGSVSEKELGEDEGAEK